MSETKPLKATGKLSRRAFVIGLPAVLAACQTSQTTAPGLAAASGAPVIDQGYQMMYAALDTEPFPVPAVNLKQIDPQFYRQVVQIPYDFSVEPGTIVIDPSAHFLYLVFENGTAIRYGVGVGREGFDWSGDASIKAKREWPKWHPPKEMMARDKEAAKWPDGMPGGPGNPLGARAMYLYQGNVDTLYRIHGTTQPWSIGKSLSSGCIRLMNQDIIDLYGRVPIGTKVKVLGNAQPNVAMENDPNTGPARPDPVVPATAQAPGGYYTPTPPGSIRS